MLGCGVVRGSCACGNDSSPLCVGSVVLFFVGGLFGCVWLKLVRFVSVRFGLSWVRFSSVCFSSVRLCMFRLSSARLASFRLDSVVLYCVGQPRVCVVLCFVSYYKNTSCLPLAVMNYISFSLLSQS